MASNVACAPEGPFFFFPPVSKRIFSTLHCAEMRPGEYFLWEDLVRVTLTLTF